MRREIGIYIYTNVMCCCKVDDHSFSNVKENQVLMQLKKQSYAISLPDAETRQPLNFSMT